MDPFTFHRVAGHTDMKTTMRYVHPSDADMDEAIMKAREAQRAYFKAYHRKAGFTENSGPRCNQLKWKEMLEPPAGIEPATC